MRVPASTEVLPDELHTSKAKTQISINVDRLAVFTEANFV